jgi:nicotinate-nucleotide--dimethylbenzimidazole phosphoribosyltransferase
VIDVSTLTVADENARSAVRVRASAVLRPTGALAALDEVAVWLAGWQRTATPAVHRPACVVFAADHGVADRGVSAYPSAVTGEMLGALRCGVATASVMSRVAGVRLHIVDVGVGRPTADLSEEAALTPDRFDEAWKAGIAAVDALDADLLVLGEMGIANTTSAAAVAASLFGGDPDPWVGLGTGIDAATLATKRAAVAQAAARAAGMEPFEVLRHVGGAELVALAAAAVQARRRSIPVLMDGYVVTSALAALHVERAGALDHVLAAHRSPEAGHRMLLERLGKVPLLDLGMRLGEGSGALLAVPIVRMAAASVVDVATFAEWEARAR